MTTAEKTQTDAPTVPPWFEELRSDFANAVHFMFLLHGGGIFDYPVEVGWPTDKWLVRQFAGGPGKPGQEVIFSISIDRGFVFASPSMRRKFEKTLGMTWTGDEELDAANGKQPGSDDHPLPNGTQPAAMLALALEFLRRARQHTDPFSPALASQYESEPLLLEEYQAMKRDDPRLPPLVRDGAKSAAMIIERADLLVPSDPTMRHAEQHARMVAMLHRASTEDDLIKAWNPIVLLSASVEGVDERVRNGSAIHQIRIGLPTVEERSAFVDRLFTANVDWLNMQIDGNELAALTAGLYRRHIEDIAQRAGDQPLTRAMALQRQKELMDTEYGQVLERIEPTFGYDSIGGHDTLKNYMLKRVVAPMRSGDSAKLRYVPMGMALCGPPGTGKSAFAIATAYEADINCVQIKNLKDKWVGSSEQNLDRLIEAIENFSPCIVFIDEFDKAFGTSEGDMSEGNVDAAMRKRLQEWLSDTRHRGRIFLLAATNYPNRVDPALFRTGRIDVKAPMLPPSTPAERVDILSRLILRYQTKGGVLDLTVFGDDKLTGGWTGSDLEFAVTKAFATAELEDMPLQAALMDAIKTIRPAGNAKIRAQIEEALRACNDLSLLPPEERSRAQSIQADKSIDEVVTLTDTASEPTVRTRRAARI